VVCFGRLSMRSAVVAAAALSGSCFAAYQPATQQARARVPGCACSATPISAGASSTLSAVLAAPPLPRAARRSCAHMSAVPSSPSSELESPSTAVLRRRQLARQQPSVPLGGLACARGAFALLTATALLAGDARVATAENELAALAGSKSTAELVRPECFAQSCKAQVEGCAADGDCMKGLACTAKCMGDAQCTVGCFARYNNDQLESVLKCTIEDAGCIAIATQAPGGDSARDAPLPPKALVKATPASLQGKWYKVLGFNPNYDCFECQRNSFQTVANTGGRRAGAGLADGLRGGSPVSMDVRPNEAIVEVEYAMPRERIGQPTELFRASLQEKLEFDTEPDSRRTAHTEGRMFGLTFWENWYLIGQNQPREPEFRFVYYTGKTLQNRYEGAFVYARKPELPQASMPAIYRIAREAGLDPTRACCIDNSCFSAPIEAPSATPPLFTPVASAGTLSAERAMQAAKPAASAASSGPFDSLTRPMRTAVRDIIELLEDPKPPAEAMFARQRMMYEVREYDANGFRRPTAEIR